MAHRQGNLELKPSRLEPVRHPRPDLSVPRETAATPDGALLGDGGTDFAACWARLARQWLAPSNPLDVIEGLTWYDLRNAALEIFSAGAVHHSATIQRFDDLLREENQKAIDRLAARSCPAGRTIGPDPKAPVDCSNMT